MNIDNTPSINKIIADSLLCHINDVQPEKHLVKDLLADSIAFADMVMNINSIFDITMSESDIIRMNTVNDIYQVLDNYCVNYSI